MSLNDDKVQMPNHRVIRGRWNVVVPILIEALDAGAQIVRLTEVSVMDDRG